MAHRARLVAVSAFVALTSFGAVARAEACEPPPRSSDPLTVRDGYLDFITPSKLAPWKAALPAVANAEVQAALSSPDTIWYDEESMVFLYQDSVEVVTGARANCVGRKTGERNRNNPPIAKLMRYFGEDYRFKFPFRTAAGTDDVSNVRVLDFWVPPRKDGRVMPVKWWKRSARGRWHWVFPVGTLFGEVLYQQAPDGRWLAFEIRTRKRYTDGWTVDIFRPFATASRMADAIVQRRPQWQQSTTLGRAVRHLRDGDNLVAHRMTSEAYAKVFEPIDGALDVIPAIDDAALVADLLTTTTFASVEGAIWKEGRGLETYAPSSDAAFGIVPKGYKMGMIPVNEVSCNRCHEHTGHPLGHFEFDIILYGEVWGEDRIFTWHLFEPHRYIYDTWDDVDGSRKINARMVQANLLRNERPAASDPDYRQLPVPYDPDLGGR